MSVESHIQQLEQRHQSLESELAHLSTMPSIKDEEILRVKRRKLQIKDEIVRLKSAN